MSGNFETKEQVQKRRQLETEERRARARELFKKSLPAEATLQFVTTSEGKGGPSKYPNQKGEGLDCPTYWVRVAPLAIENDLNSVQMEFEETIFITLPLINLDIEGHKPGNSVTNDASKVFQALAPSRVQYVDKGTPGAWKNDPETRAATDRQAVATDELAADLFAGDAKIGEVTFYGDVKHKKSEKGGYRIKAMSTELLPGKTWTAPVEVTPAEASN